MVLWQLSEGFSGFALCKQFWSKQDLISFLSCSSDNLSICAKMGSNKKLAFHKTICKKRLILVCRVHLFIMHFLRFVPLETVFCVQARRKLRYLKDMQILYGIDSKRRMISEVFHGILEACHYGITLDLSASNGYSSKFLFINLELEFYIPSL